MTDVLIARTHILYLIANSKSDFEVGIFTLNKI